MTDVLLAIVAGLVALLLGFAAYGIKRVDKMATSLVRLETAVLGPEGGHGLIHEVMKLRTWRGQASDTLLQHEGRIATAERDIGTLQRKAKLA